MLSMGRHPFYARLSPEAIVSYLGEVVDESVDPVVLEGVPVEGDPVEGDPVEGDPVEGLPDIPDESPFMEGLLLVVPLLVEPLVPCPVVLLPLDAPVESVLLPMLPGWPCVP